MEFDIPEGTYFTRVYIERLGPVAEEVQPLEKNKGCFFYPFVEAGKEYAIRFVFLRDEDRDENDRDISFGHRYDDGVLGWFETKVTAGENSKGEVRFTSKGRISVDKRGNFRFTQPPTFQNEDLLAEDGNNWEVEIGLVEGISWAHGAERRTKWHDMQESIPSDKLTETINLYEKCKPEARGEYSIDFICVRPIMNYKHDGKTYKYQWDSFVEDIYYPPIMSPDLIHGIYLEYPVVTEEEYSRCDVTIDGIGKVAEEVKPLDENPARASFFYPFVEPGKEYTIRFQFKKPEPVDSEGFTLPTQGNDTLTEVTMNVTAGARAKGEVRLPWENVGNIKVDSNCNIIHFEKPTFENESLLGNNWIVEIALMEGISWDHGDERRTKWHCAVQLSSKDFNTSPVGKNLRNLKMSPGYTSCQHDHAIDCLCVRPIMFYEYDSKEYKYQWDGYTSDVHYPLNTDFQEIDINNSADIAKIIGTWKQNEEWDDTEYFPTKVHTVYNETLIIDDTNVKRSYSFKYTKLNGNAFTKQEIIDGWCYYELANEMLNSDSYFSYEVGDFQYEYEYGFPPDMEIPHYKYKFWILHHGSSLSSDYRTLTEKNDNEGPLSMYYGDWDDIDDKGYTRHYELKLFQDGRELQVLTYGTDEDGYYEWTDIYTKQ